MFWKSSIWYSIEIQCQCLLFSFQMPDSRSNEFAAHCNISAHFYGRGCGCHPCNCVFAPNWNPSAFICHVLITKTLSHSAQSFLIGARLPHSNFAHLIFSLICSPASCGGDRLNTIEESYVPESPHEKRNALFQFYTTWQRLQQLSSKSKYWTASNEAMIGITINHHTRRHSRVCAWRVSFIRLIYACYSLRGCNCCVTKGDNKWQSSPAELQ